jgi:hypothetical protein
MDMSDELRFGVICDGAGLRQWEARCVNEMVNSGAAALELIVHIARPPSGNSHGSGRGERASSRLLRAVRKHLSRCDAFRPTPAREIFPRTPRLTIEDAGIYPSGSVFPSDHIDKIGRLGLHFILGFTGADIPADIPGVAQFGIWIFPHDRLERCTGTSPFLTELARGENTVGVQMQALTADPDTVLLLREGRFKLCKHSYRETINSIYFQCAKWPAWVCKNLSNGGPDFFPSIHKSTEAVPAPPSGEALTWQDAVRALGWAISHKYHSLFRHAQWNIGIIPAPISGILEGGRIPKVNYLEITEGRSRFRADPFGLGHDGELTVLYEDFDYRTNKGTIQCGRLMEGNRLSDVRQVFDMPFHMSYPYIFTSQGEIYCVPESGRDRRAGLYRAVQFPEVWEKVCDLVENMAATDATVFFYGERWWVACTDRDHDPDLNLFLWYADRLEGPWFPHAVNPVKTDVRSARPAGTPFLYQGKLYRPAQDCSVRYGGRTLVNLVHALTPTEFREEPVAVVEPPANGSFSEGLHTLCSVGDITIVDGYRTVFVWAQFKRAIAHRMNRIRGALSN